MLLVLMTTTDTDVATTSVLHLWYSGRITQECLRCMEKARGIVQYVCNSVEEKELTRSISAPKDLVTYRYEHKFGPSSIVMDFAAATWKALLGYFDVPPGLTMFDSEQRRYNTMASEDSQDYRDYRYILRTIPGWGPSAELFRVDGVLLPSGHPLKDFTFSNPTLSNEDHGQWPMDGMADPMAGWPLAEVFATESAAINDIYGKLYHYVRGQLATFHRRLSNTKLNFQVFNLDVSALAPHFVRREQEPYDRIEVRTKAFAEMSCRGVLCLLMLTLTHRAQLSNIADCQYVGITKSLSLLGPLLRPRAQNKHATLIIYFMTAISKIRPGKQLINGTWVYEKYQGVEAMEMAAKIARYLSHESNTGALAHTMPPKNQVDTMRMAAAAKLFLNTDKEFDKYMQEYDFAGAARSASVHMKADHTIVDKWPLAMKREPHEPGAIHELQLLLGSIWYSYPQSWVRYTEWKRQD